MRRAISICWICAALFGCSTTPAADTGGGGTALPYRLLVAMPEYAPPPAETVDESTGGVRVEADLSTLATSLIDALRAERIFQDVSRLPATEKGEEGVLRSVRERADFLLETRVRKREATYLGRNGLLIPNLLLSIIAWPVSWWVKDEIYALDLEVEVTLRSWSSGLVMQSDVHRVRVEENLNDFERGWMILGLLRVPGSLDEENWRCVDRSLAPKAEADLARRAAGLIGRGVRVGVHSPEFKRAFTSRYGLVIGISQFRDHGIRNLRFADADARSFAEHLTGAGRIPAHNVALLLNDAATLDGIRKALRQVFAEGAGEGDEIIIYFAGYGAWRGGRAYLLPHDADSERPATTGLPLADLFAMAQRPGGPRVTLILDAPFVSDFLGRGVTEAWLGGEFEAALGEFLEIPGHRVLTASRVGEGCIELEDVGGGLFTYYLIQGLEGKGDRNRDGRVTWEEAAAYAGWMVGVHAPLEGKVQRPGYFAAADLEPGGGSPDDPP